MTAAFLRLTVRLAWVSAVLFVMAGALLACDLLARRLPVGPVAWAADLAQLCLVWGTLLAMAWLLGARRHIAVDVLVALLSAQQRRYTEAFAMLVVALFSAVVVWQGWAIAVESISRGPGSEAVPHLPAWTADLAVPFGFALLFVQALIEAKRALAGELDALANGPGARE
ncbi:TRAP transporter small permease [Polymorphum gilvum]|uniref:TRAP transporter small permease protein n=1 Tax=Polymorphum gilvum (strain LMG 25793 / CGMCC 1.9160 / SL003B-26A1) TaxID=991905 RepID=F2IVV5_POLGS|nr:TRAP transporter small permease [Polymorphum gilvum]ADZ69212.1 TRAP transporter, DctQ-like membrane protein [Polymorphum gilvum SL003B-26A1]